MTEQVALIPQEKENVVNGTLLQTMQKKIPILAKAHAGATAAMAKIIKVETDEEIQQATDLLIAVRTTYEKMQGMRKEMTDPIDQLKDFIMDFERPLNTDIKSNSEYARIKKMIGAAEQLKIERNKKAEEEARNKRLKEQAINDAKAAVKLNITEMIINRCEQVEKGLQSFFKEIKDAEDLDKKIKAFEGTKWKMKQEDYDKCFAFGMSHLSSEDVRQLNASMREDLPFDNINVMLMEKVNPIITKWKANIPQIREEWKAIFSEKDEQKRRDLEQEKAKRDQEEASRREAELKHEEASMKADVMSENTVNNVESDFKEQATVQGLEKTGPKKKVIKFKSDKPAAELAKMIYHMFSSPKFKGIYKLKDGQKVLDDRGRPVYVDWVDSITSFFAQNCDAAIENTEVFEDAKTIIRK